MVKNRIDSSIDSLQKEHDLFLIDVVQDRPISLELAKALNVEHQSPQMIKVSKGRVVAHHSHTAVRSENYL